MNYLLLILKSILLIIVNMCSKKLFTTHIEVYLVLDKRLARNNEDPRRMRNLARAWAAVSSCLGGHAPPAGLPERINKISSYLGGQAART